MRINTNMNSLRALRFLGNTTKQFAATLEKLSSGRRINSARDDVSGMAVTNGLTAQIRGMRQNILNINQSVGYLTTSDGVLATQGQIVQRMRELAVQAANGTLSSNDRSYLNTEFQQLLTEFDRLAVESRYGSSSLVGEDLSLSLQVGTQKGQEIDLETTKSTSSSSFTRNSTTYNFSTKQSFAVTTGLSHVADFNQDGVNDFLTSNGASMSLHFGTGNGLLSSARNISTGLGNPYDSEIADFNNDGVMDFVATGQVNGVTSMGIFLNTGYGSFTSVSTGAGNSRVGIGDFNSDGFNDIVVTHLGVGTSIMMNNGDGTFRDRVLVTTNAGELDVVVGDFNKDGNIDFTVGALSVHLGNGNGTFQTEIAGPGGGGGRSTFHSGDFNGDGIIDMAQASEGGGSTVVYSLGNGNGTFKAFTSLTTLGNSREIDVADFDGDGDDDIIAVGHGTNATLSVFSNDGTASFTRYSTTLSFGKADGTERAVVVDDLDGDGVNDLILGGTGEFQVLHSQAAFQDATSQMTITTQDKASRTLEILDNALLSISEKRASIGALMNRLDSAESVTSVGLENIESSRSAILDADMSSETAEFARLQILNQGSVATLTQANIEMRMVLNLINNNR